MARHDDVRVERDDRVQGGGPARERPFPADRRAEPEENVAREDDALGGQVDDDVTRRVSRPDMDEPCLETAQVARQPGADMGLLVLGLEFLLRQQEVPPLAE